MIRALCLRLMRAFGWEKSVQPRLKPKRMPRGWWRRPSPFDRNWRAGIDAKPF